VTYFFWLALSIVIEAPILWMGLRQPLLRTLLYAVLINGITHPMAWWFVEFRGANLWPVEVIVAVVETVLIWLAFKVTVRRALVWSVAANVTSAGAGLLVSIFHY
jgi:hypothetical protein